MVTLKIATIYVIVNVIAFPNAFFPTTHCVVIIIIITVQNA